MTMKIDNMFHRKRRWVFVVSVDTLKDSCESLKFQVYLAKSRNVFSLHGNLKAIIVYQQIVDSRRTNSIFTIDHNTM